MHIILNLLTRRPNIQTGKGNWWFCNILRKWSLFHGRTVVIPFPYFSPIFVNFHSSVRHVVFDERIFSSFKTSLFIQRQENEKFIKYTSDTNNETLLMFTKAQLMQEERTSLAYSLQQSEKDLTQRNRNLFSQQNSRHFITAKKPSDYFIIFYHILQYS